MKSNNRFKNKEFLYIAEQQIFITHTNTKPNLPEGFEFLPVKRNIIINKEKSDKISS